jgi:hypothetical protein
VIEEIEPCALVPVCPVVYPDVPGLFCHASCLAEEREKNRFLRPGDLSPDFLRWLVRGARRAS